jgi:phage-related minor tail protein
LSDKDIEIDGDNKNLNDFFNKRKDTINKKVVEYKLAGIDIQKNEK